MNDLVLVDPDRVSGQVCFKGTRDQRRPARALFLAYWRTAPVPVRFKGTRVPVQTLIDHIEGNLTLDDFVAGFPPVTREQAIRFIELAKDNLLAA